MLNLNRNSGKLIQFAIFIVAVLCSFSPCEGCGSFVDATTAGTNIGTGSNYEAYSNCVWWVEAPASHVVTLLISQFVGEKSSSGSCLDYVLVYDGSPTGTELLNTCDTQTNFEVNSTGRWLWVQFKSDGANATAGLTANVKATASASSSGSDPVVACKTHQYKCSNKVCLTKAYLCDGFNDCGCSNDCDEQGCGGISLTKSEYTGLGVAIGAGMFISMFIFTFVFEKRRKLKALREEEEEQRAMRRRGGKGSDKDAKKDKGKDSKVAWHK